MNPIPDIIPVLGLTDDANVIFWTYVTVKESIKPDHQAKAREWLKKVFGGSDA